MEFNASLIDILNSKTKLKIVKFLLTHEASMSEREIASVLKVSHMSINRTMQELSEVNFVNFITIGKAHLWKVNRKSYAFKMLSEFIEGVSRIKDPLDDLKNIILKSTPKALVKKVVLFGSVAKGAGKLDSDIDVFFLVKDNKDKEKLGFALEKLSNACLETYGNRLSPYILTEQETKKKARQKFLSEINKGIKIFPF
ncbi:MAG: nucleotidyltransferase domain-containing protein [Candidatus Omnitrophica bacterium]|nr:nucleotidyltransferase domain-containing protein [Candidatus Omnitrophota bacterium]MCG2708128.1 nucleotidyltransferase domain-containing protein [Candidatus Omnitrophota bacterium]